jgi:MerR family mercuric resistance operon transcriptional regulator
LVKFRSALGVNIETIHYYERLGLLPKPAANGRRVFEHLRRLTFIRRARAMGFSQDEVRALLVLADDGAQSCGEVRTLPMCICAQFERRLPT